MPEIRKILVPTDFSVNSMRALDYAKELASRFAADIVLVHVVQPPIYPAMTFGTGAAGLPALQDEMRDAASAQLERVQREELGDHPSATTILREGSPFVEIIGAARDQQADLIVIATHGHTGIKHLLLGSTTEKVVRKSPCPVLTIRDPAHEFTAP